MKTKNQRKTSFWKDIRLQEIERKLTANTFFSHVFSYFCPRENVLDKRNYNNANRNKKNNRNNMINNQNNNNINSKKMLIIKI